MNHGIVLLAGLAAIGWVNWYFFLAKRGPVVLARTDQSGRQEVRIVVHGGYDPATVEARAGVPLRLVFDRQETSSCSEEIVVPAFGIRQFLPAFQKTAIDLPGASPGTYDFTCGMSMLHGTIKVR
ncbi:MAG: cupredoxin domain-containing protein [Gemmatimonadota bacterium]